MLRNLHGKFTEICTAQTRSIWGGLFCVQRISAGVMMRGISSNCWITYLPSTFTTTRLFTVAVKRPKTAKPDGFSVFNPSDFSLSTSGRLIIDVSHYRLFLSAPLHIIATVPKRAIYPCATRADFARVRRGAVRAVSVVSDRIGSGAGCVGCG